MILTVGDIALVNKEDKSYINVLAEMAMLQFLIWLVCKVKKLGYTNVDR